MQITISSETLGKKSTISRETLRKIMIEVWRWEQPKADSHLVALEMSPNTLTIPTDNGDIILQALG